MHARPDQSNDQDHEPSVEQVFSDTAHFVCPPKALMSSFPIKNVQKAHADCDDARHQKCGGQDNMLNHGNASFVADTSQLPRAACFNPITIVIGRGEHQFHSLIPQPHSQSERPEMLP